MDDYTPEEMADAYNAFVVGVLLPMRSTFLQHATWGFAAGKKHNIAEYYASSFLYSLEHVRFDGDMAKVPIVYGPLIYDIEHIYSDAQDVIYADEDFCSAVYDAFRSMRRVLRRNYVIAFPQYVAMFTSVWSFTSSCLRLLKNALPKNYARIHPVPILRKQVVVKSLGQLARESHINKFGQGTMEEIRKLGFEKAIEISLLSHAEMPENVSMVCI
jgi:hypothetical protein